MITYLQHRRLIKHLRQLLREAKHLRNMKEDIAEPRILRILDEACQQARRSLQARDWPAMEAALRGLENAIHPMCPPRTYAVIREYVEIIVVAVAVAMAFRTYFIQPFKIPTASMSPTLHGIHFAPQDRQGLTDRLPLNLVKWLIWGEWYVEVRAKTSGQVRIEPTQEGGRMMVINGLYHPVPKDMSDRVAAGDLVVRDQLLASGIRITGDHIFVDKVSWNFRPPHRGEIMVFKTAGINHPQIKPNEHYVKRMVGLPNERLSINPPDLLINGKKTAESRFITRVESRRDGYDGYQLGGADYRMADCLKHFTNNVGLGPDQYFACGDNQLNSADSRYWGPVPRKNLVGPAFLVYWPISRHWGLAE